MPDVVSTRNPGPGDKDNKEDQELSRVKTADEKQMS